MAAVRPTAGSQPAPDRELFPGSSHPSTIDLQNFTKFGLTPAEAAVAADLHRGMPLSEIARSRGVSIHTVRNQVKAVLAKTGTTRQVDLVLLMNRLQISDPGKEPTA